MIREKFITALKNVTVTNITQGARMIELIYKLIVCHFIGDYVLQIDYIARTKGDNWWHLIVHCFLYTVPFAILFGVDWRLGVILGLHIVVDSLKARLKRIGYVTDQVIHLTTLSVYLL